MNENEKKKGGAEQTYLKPLYANLVAAKSKYTGMSKSSVIADAVQKCFDSMPVADREHLLNVSKNRY